MANSRKKVKIGALVSGKDKNGRAYRSLVLGNKSTNDEYTTRVEVTVKDAAGKVLYTQTDGFLNLVDPRTQPDDLLAAGLISPELHEKMKSGVKNLSDKVKYVLEVSV